MSKNSLLAALMATALSLPSVQIAAQEHAAPTTVQADGATITVSANNAPLRDLLIQLRDQAGFALVEGSEPLQSLVTITLDGVPWSEGIAEILRGYSYALAMDPRTNQPAKLVILSSKLAEVTGDTETDTTTGAGTEPALSAEQATAPDEAESSLEEATRIANELIAQRENPLEFAMRQAREAAANAAEAQDDRGSGKKRQAGEARYADSLRALGEFQDPERLSVLDPALDSRSRDVRGAALEALRDGTVRDQSVLSRVRSLITSDPDPSVRRAALEVYARYGDQADVLVLVQSLGRENGVARDIAVREWLRIERELAEASQADRQLRR